VGRPSRYSKTLGLAICERIAGGETVVSICGDAKMPGRTTLFRWIVENEEFRDLYAIAREQCADAWFDEALKVSRDADDNCDPKLVPGSRLYVDTLKWAAAKLRPRSYSDKLQLEHSGGQTVTMRTDLSALSDEELEALERIHAKLADTPPAG
jgi:hypothetical protein